MKENQWREDHNRSLPIRWRVHHKAQPRERDNDCDDNEREEEQPHQLNVKAHSRPAYAFGWQHLKNLQVEDAASIVGGRGLWVAHGRGP